MTAATNTRKRTRVLALLAVLGPGIVAASAGNDAGGISTYSVAGAEFGYATLWMIFVMTFSLIVVQEMAARMGAVTGKGFSALIREKFGVRPTLFAMIALLLSNAATSVAEFAGIAAAGELFGISRYVAVPIAAIVVWGLVVRGSYRNVEKVFLALSSVFLGLHHRGIPRQARLGRGPARDDRSAVHPDTRVRADRGGHHRHDDRAVDAVLRAEQHRRQGCRRRAARASAHRCHRRGGIRQHRGVVHHRDHGYRALPAGNPGHRRRAGRRRTRPVAGQYATVLFAVGLAAASMLAACVLPLTAAYAITEAFGWERGIDRSWSEAPAFNAIYTFVIVFGAALVLIPGAPLITIMVLSQAVNGILLPFLLLFMIRIVNDRRIMGRYTNGRVTAATNTRKRTRVLALLAVLGPGIVAASAGNDAGGISTYSVAGAEFGYATLWMIFVMTFSLIVVQEMAARMGAVTGKGFSALIREKFGVRPTLFAMIALLLSNAATSVAEFAGIAAAGELFGISRYVTVPIAAIVVWGLVVRGSYRNVEKVFLALSSVFLAYIVAAFLAKPDWGEVLHATIVPQFIPTPGFVLIVVATIGTTIAPWMQFFVQSNIVDKGVDVEQLGLQRIDVIAGAVSANIVAWFIIVTTGTVLYPQGIRVTGAEQAAAALAPVAGQYATVLFAIGLAAASMLAACVLPLTAAYAITEAFGWERGIDRSWAEAPAFNAIYTFVIAFGAALVLVPGAPLITIMVLSQAVNGILLPFLLLFMIRIVNDRRIMGRYTNGRVTNALAWGTVITVIALTITLFGMQIGQAVGLL